MALQEIALFSYDASHQYRADDSSLRYYYTPEIGVNLSDGFNAFIKHDDSVDEHLDSLLRTLEGLERKTGQRCTADIITWRGMMTKIMSLPFNLRDRFIEENHAFKMTCRRPNDQRGNMMSYWGYRFETLSTLPKPWDDCTRAEIEGRVREVVSNEAQFCSIVKTGFDNIRIILGGEVDASTNPPYQYVRLVTVWVVWDSRPEDPSLGINYVELKTSKIVESERDEVAFERKLQRIWSQSFLLGVNKVIVGFRDNNGFLARIEEFDTQGIPSIAKRSGRNLWDGKYAIDFAAAFCDWLVTNVKSYGREGHVWRLRYQADSGMVELFPMGEQQSFLTNSFLKWREILATND